MDLTDKVEQSSLFLLSLELVLIVTGDNDLIDLNSWSVKDLACIRCIRQTDSFETIDSKAKKSMKSAP